MESKATKKAAWAMAPFFSGVGHEPLKVSSNLGKAIKQVFHLQRGLPGLPDKNMYTVSHLHDGDSMRAGRTCLSLE